MSSFKVWIRSSEDIFCLTMVNILTFYFFATWFRDIRQAVFWMYVILLIGYAIIFHVRMSFNIYFTCITMQSCSFLFTGSDFCLSIACISTFKIQCIFFSLKKLKLFFISDIIEIKIIVCDQIIILTIISPFNTKQFICQNFFLNKFICQNYTLAYLTFHKFNC